MSRDALIGAAILGSASGSKSNSCLSVEANFFGFRGMARLRDHAYCDSNRYIPAGKPYARVPIVVVTAGAMKGSEERYLAIGANAYVSKPIDLKALTAAMRKVLDGARGREAA